jgi:ligand-binding sensor domain-containing protein
MKYLVTLFLFLTTLNILCSAQTTWRIYNTSNSGLTDNYIRTLAVDSQGVIWIGTQNKGVFRYDGITWTNYNSNNSILADDYILTVAVAPDSALWVGMRSGGVARLKDTSWHEFWTGNSPLPSDHIQEITFDGDTVWFGTYGGLVKLIDTAWTIYNSSNSGLPYNTVNSIQVDPSHNKWVATSGYGVLKFNGTTWTTYNVANSQMPSNYPFAIHWHDSLWVAYSGNGIATLNNGICKKYDPGNSGIPSVYTYCFSHDGPAVWVGTAAGAAKFDGNTWSAYDTANSILPNKYVRALAVDRKGNKWIGTLNGLAVFNETGIVESAKDDPAYIPSHFELSQNYPNPFNPTTTFKFSIANSQLTILKIYDVLGREVATLTNEVKQPGTYTVQWDASAQPSGVYLCRLQSGFNMQTSKMILIK